MNFASPSFLILFLAVAFIIWLYVRNQSKKRFAIRFSDTGFRSVLKKTWKIRFFHLPFILRVLAYSCIIIALARPREQSKHEEILSYGVDIMIVMDVSTSMKALDFKPDNRLAVSKQTVRDFITKRPTDRMGLVIFSARAYTKCPLTLDHEILHQFVNDIDFGNIEDGTAIGTALATAANRLTDTKAKSRIIILCTDGANNRGEITPIVAAQACSKLGIKVYTIGIGKQGAVPYPFLIQNPWTGAVETQVQMIQSDLDETTLKDIAKTTNGKYFRATNRDELEQIYSMIDKMEKSEIKTVSYSTYSERFMPWVYTALILLLLEILLQHTVLRRLPD